MIDTPEKAQKLRLAISGATGAGKTTLAQDLAYKLQLPLLNENWKPIQEAQKRYFSLKKNETSQEDEIRTAFQNWKLSYKAWLDDRYQEQSKLDGFVSDRWAVDAYSNWLRVFRPGSDDRMVLSLLKTLYVHSRMYDYFILLPVKENVSEERNNDGIKRAPSVQVRIMSNGLNAGLITHFLQRPLIQIPGRKMSRKERVNFVLKRINETNADPS